MAKETAKKSSSTAKKKSESKSEKTAVKEPKKNALKKTAPAKAKAASKKTPAAAKPAKAVETPVVAPVEEAEAAAEPKKRAPRKSKKNEVPQGTVIGSPRLAGLRHAPGVRIEAPKAVPETNKMTEAPKKLTKKEIQEIKQRLLAMREANMSNLRKKLEDDQERSDKLAADVIDQASDACDEDMSLEIASTKDEQLQLINTALENIENGTYGQCIMCGDTIPATRLRLLPFVIRCKNCKDIYEKTRRRHDANWALVNGSMGGGTDDAETEEPAEE